METNPNKVEALSLVEDDYIILDSRLLHIIRITRSKPGSEKKYERILQHTDLVQKVKPEILTKSCLGVKDKLLIILCEDGETQEEEYIINTDTIEQINSIVEADGICLINVIHSESIKACINAFKDVDDVN